MSRHPAYADLFRQFVFRARGKAPLSLAFAGLLLAGTALSVAAQEPGRLTQITGQSPFAGCTADGVGNQDGTNYPESEIEPWIDANPSDARNLIASWQQDRWSNGGSRGDLSGYSTNGGATWTTVKVPKTTACTGGKYKRASDPWVSFSPDGAAYYFTLAFDPDLPDGAFGPNAVLVSRSTDGGVTWGDPIVVKKDKAGQTLNDKNSLTADPNDSQFAYAVWDRLTDFTLPPGKPTAGAVKATAGAGDGVLAARQRAKQLAELAKGGTTTAQVFFKGPAYFSRTTDGGNSWEPIKKIHDPGGNAQTINNLAVVQPGGTLFDFFTEISPSNQTRIGFVRSSNKGETFDTAHYAADITTTFGSITPDTHEPVRDAAILFDVGIDPSNGNLYLVWQDTRFQGIDETAFSMSTDGGDTWSDPVKINKTPHNANNNLREQAILPTIAVDKNGRLVATYYDYRFDTDDGHESLDDWTIICDATTVDCRTPSNWSVELRLTKRSFDILKAPQAGGYFLGDYMGLVAARTNVFPAFGIVDGQQRTSIFTRKIRVGTGASTAAE